MDNKVINQFKAARKASAPLVAITTPDAPATIDTILKSYEEPPPAVSWDCMRGIRALNKHAEKAVASITAEAGECRHFAEALAAAAMLPGMSDDNPRGCVLFMHNAQLFISEPQFIQGASNLRDAYKSDRRTLVMLAPSIKLPPELANDTLLFDEALPNDDAVSSILASVHESGKQAMPKDIAPMLAATAGLPAFMVEQTAAMSLTEKGMDIAGLWERKRAAIEQTPGLQVWRGKENFGDIAGYDNVKAFLTRFLKGKKAPRVIVFIDEIEKALAGLAGDTSGVTQDQLGALLSFMQDEQADGMLLLGPAGTGKSNLAKASGKEAGVPVVAMDLGAMKHEHVGGSEARMRGALKAVKSMGQSRLLFIATCNSLAILPPELRRRFKCGTFFMDLPTKEERRGIWAIYLEQFPIKIRTKEFTKVLPNDDGWTGAEIKQCCSYAADFDCSLAEASQYIVPVAKSAADIVEGLRRAASGRFLSASKPGIYHWEAEQKPAITGRAINNSQAEI